MYHSGIQHTNLESVSKHNFGVNCFSLPINKNNVCLDEFSFACETVPKIQTQIYVHICSIIFLKSPREGNSSLFLYLEENR